MLLNSRLVAKAGDTINCHNAEEVGRSVQEEIDYKCFPNVQQLKQVKRLRHYYQ